MLDDRFCGKRQYQRLHFHSKCTSQLVCTIRVLCDCLNFPITWGINRKGKVITKIIGNNHQNWILLFFVHHSLPTPFERLKKPLEHQNNTATIQYHYDQHCDHQNLTVATREEMRSRGHSKYWQFVTFT